MDIRFPYWVIDYSMIGEVGLKLVKTVVLFSTHRFKFALIQEDHELTNHGGSDCALIGKIRVVGSITQISRRV